MLKRLVVLFLLVFQSVFGQLDQVRDWTKTLCSPEMHGRGYVAGGDSLAAIFLTSEYQKIGLASIPGQSNMMQAFQFPVNTFPAEMSVRLGGKELVPGEDFIVDPASGSFKGKLNFVALNATQIYQTENLNPLLFEHKEKYMNALVADLSGVKGDSLKIIKARLKNWTSSITVIELYSAKFTWSVAQEAFRFPYLFLRDSLWQNQSVEIDIQNKLIPNHIANNVLAYLPAKKKTKKTIFFSAHYDHLGQMGSSTYFPGANDNASGSAILLSLASYFKKNPAKYNIVFAAFAGEEAGLLGSRYYVNHPIIPLSEMRFLLNLDIMGSGEEGITVVNATLFPKEFKQLQKINEQSKLLFAVKSRGPAANSDHYFFSENGVPAFFIYTMGPNKHYHDIYDTYEALSFAEYSDLTELLKRFVKKL
jgi:aminopeptidase YwaD